MLYGSKAWRIFMFRLKDWPVQTKLIFMVGIFLLCFLLFAILSFQTLSYVEIKGPLYRQIDVSDKLLVDTAPPSLYILESYALVRRIGDATDKSLVQDLVNRLRSEEKRYKDRHSFWLKELPEGSVKED